MLSESTIDNLSAELEEVEKELKVLKARRKGIIHILGIKASDKRTKKEPPKDTPEPEAASEPPQNASESFKVPLSFKFSYLSSQTNEWVEVKDNSKFVPGIVFQAIKGNRVIPFHGNKVLKVVEVKEDHLVAVPNS